MRWGANRTLPEAERRHIEAVYSERFHEWLRWLPCYDSFPFRKVNIKVVGWATYHKSLLPGVMDDVNVYAGFEDDLFNLPACNPGCSRYQHLDGNYTDCPGGRDNRFHQFLLLDPSWGEHNMGAASGFGVSISLYGWETVGSQQEDWPMLTHELVSACLLFSLTWLTDLGPHIWIPRLFRSPDKQNLLDLLCILATRQFSQ